MTLYLATHDGKGLGYPVRSWHYRKEIESGYRPELDYALLILEDDVSAFGSIGLSYKQPLKVGD